MLRKVIKAKTTASFRRALRDIAEEFRIQRLHHASLRRVNRYSRGNLKLNVGCGKNLKHGWVNIDLSRNADLQLDLREPLPFKAESASMIYSEHFFEHLEYPDQAFNFLGESLRVLQAGGLFSVGVPDTEWPIRSYADEDEEYFLIVRQRWHPEWCNTRMHNLNYHFRQGREHKYAYDFETLSQIMSEVGFVSIVTRPFNPSLDDERRNLGTLYLDANKKPNTALNSDARPRTG
ncbi:MAG: methyltransferase domain-containing protein [bacterium]|nr:methyltransferase domain-containing protein [bacterium]